VLCASFFFFFPFFSLPSAFVNSRRGCFASTCIAFFLQGGAPSITVRRGVYSPQQSRFADPTLARDAPRPPRRTILDRRRVLHYCQLARNPNSNRGIFRYLLARFRCCRRCATEISRVRLRWLLFIVSEKETVHDKIKRTIRKKQRALKERRLVVRTRDFTRNIINRQASNNV
jgi:hypothetical protein